MPKLEDYELEAMYVNFIDETTEAVTIWGMEFLASDILKECDPVAFRVGYSDWLDGLDDCDDCEKNPSECTCEVAA